MAPDEASALASFALAELAAARTALRRTLIAGAIGCAALFGLLAVARRSAADLLTPSGLADRASAAALGAIPRAAAAIERPLSAAAPRLGEALVDQAVAAAGVVRLRVQSRLADLGEGMAATGAGDLAASLDRLLADGAAHEPERAVPEAVAALIERLEHPSPAGREDPVGNQFFKGFAAEARHLARAHEGLLALGEPAGEHEHARLRERLIETWISFLR